MTRAPVATFKAKSGYPPVEVEWLDAAYNGGYLADGDTFNTGIVCTNVGMLIYENKEFVVLGQSVDEEGKIRQFWQVPRSWVLRVTYLKPGSQPRKRRGGG